MKKKDMNTNEIIELIYKEIKITLDQHTAKLEEHDKRLESLEKKTDKMEEVKDFDRIVLSDFGSRITILEEESEKYNIN